ncbi:hypothetical protein [Empedobacter tilapiae]|uniref:hypothetical protein n=1 Tax=Empedobacter tilapiae TaxID=2491114 RepID=UPI0028D25115|nr:hypothetical protein [Empedobacter tilapiae]
MEGLKLIKSTEIGLTWKEVKELLNTYTDEQLESKAILHRIDNEECKIDGLVIDEFYETEEDFINPSGECIEPISLYEDDNSNEEIVLKKGTPILYIS